MTLKSNLRNWRQYLQTTYLMRNYYANINETPTTQQQKNQIVLLKKWTKDLNKNFFNEDIQMANVYASESHSVVSNSLRPHGLAIQSMEFSRPE